MHLEHLKLERKTNNENVFIVKYEPGDYFAVIDIDAETFHICKDIENVTPKTIIV